MPVPDSMRNKDGKLPLSPAQMKRLMKQTSPPVKGGIIPTLRKRANVFTYKDSESSEWFLKKKKRK